MTTLTPSQQVRERHLCKLAEHCVSVIALCRRSSPAASGVTEQAYEAHLAKINWELRELRDNQAPFARR